MQRLAVAFLFVVGCAKPGGGGGGFRVFYPDAGTRGIRAKVGARVQAKPAADCRNVEGALARWANTGAQLAAGELPPGLAIEDGAIAGAPTAAGTWRVTVKFTGVTCAAAPVTDQLVDVEISVSAGR